MDNITLPANIEAEAALIGAILRFPEDLPAIATEPDEMYNGFHRVVWATLKELNAKGRAIQDIAIIDLMRTRGQFAELGVSELEVQLSLARYQGKALNVGDPQEPARIIRVCHQRRKLLEQANIMARIALDESNDPTDELASVINGLVGASSIPNGAKHWREYLSQLFDEIQERVDNPQDEWGMPTGFATFDRITGGLQRGELFFLSGKPGVGKSMLAMQMGTQLAASAPGVIYSAEMKGITVTRRIVSARSSVAARQLKTGRMNDDELAKVLEAIEALSDLPVYMADPAGIKTTEVQADLARLKAQHNVEWFIFDYMLLAGDASGLNEVERSSVLSRSFKLICRNLDIAGIVINSMNKVGIEKAAPELSNLRGSAQVAFDADLVAFLTEFQPIGTMDGFIPQQEQDNMATLVFSKGRELEDPRKYIHFVKRPGFPSFAEYTPEPTPAQRIRR